MKIKRAISECYAATRALDENSLAEYAAGVEGETGVFLWLNNEVHETEAKLPWALRPVIRWFIDRKIIRELGYWDRMDEIERTRQEASA
jgi:hypothetical protein